MKLIFIGSQGSGKSTQAKMLSVVLGIPYIETGQLFREKAQGKSKDSGVVKEALDSGNLVPDQIAVETLRERVAREDCRNGYILDGYPRNYAQLEGLDGKFDKVFYIKVSDQEAIRRLIGRGRQDDSLDLISKRLEIYHRESEPLITYFKQQGVLEEIDGERPIPKIHEEIITKIKNGQG